MKAFVALVPGTDPSEILPEELVDHCAVSLARFKVPRYIEYVSGEFPRTPSMRIKKNELVARSTEVDGGHWIQNRSGQDQRARETYWVCC